MSHLVRKICRVGLLAALCGCAPTVYQTAGKAGALQWQAVDLEPSRRSVDGRETDAYDFTLVVRETRGVGITFTHAKNDIYQRNLEGHSEREERFDLSAYCELHLPFSSTGFRAPLWNITLSGKDERQQPVSVAIQAALPPDPSQTAVPMQTVDTQTRHGKGVRTALSVAERRRIKILNLFIDPAELEPFFQNSGERKIAPVVGATVIFDSRIPPAARRGLRNLAGGFILGGTLRPDSMLVTSIDTPAPRGIRAAVRFIFATRDPRPEHCPQEILIEPVSFDADGATDISRPADLSVLARHAFHVTDEWAESERRALAATIARIPDPWLSSIEGLTFKRARAHPQKADYAGVYDSETHSITMFDHAFKPFAARFAVADKTQAAIAHELGHAFDFNSIRQSAERHRLALTALERVFGRYKIPGKSDEYYIPSGQEKAWGEHSERVARHYRALKAARTMSGARIHVKPLANRFELTDDDDGDSTASEFRRSAEMDGPVRISAYAEIDWREYFAECFSLYAMEPEALEWLRPNIYAYFTKYFPR